MSKITIILNDKNKIHELLNMVTALPYVESAHFEEAVAETNGRHGPLAEVAIHTDEDDSPFYRDPQTHLMDKEIAAFETMKATLIADYLGQYVAIFQGSVVDHDGDKGLLLDRIAQTYPHDVVLIRQVRRQPRPPFRLRSPKLQRN